MQIAIFSRLLKKGLGMTSIPCYFFNNALPMQYRILNLHLSTAFGLMVVLVFWWGSQAHLLGAVMGVLTARLVTIPLILIGILQTLKQKS